MKTIDQKHILNWVFMLAVTVLLVFISALAISGTVLSQSRQASKEQKEYHQALEEEYVEEVRAYLEKQGYANSGVTINRIIENDGSVEYTVTIHHRRILALESAKREALALECGKIEFPMEDCSLCYTFLETSF